MPANRNVTSIETYSGQFVDLIHPASATIRLEDIAVHLANTVRFAGGVTKYYSVAEHAVRVSQMVRPELALAALHHDSHEFVLGDLPAPLKAALNQMGAGGIVALLAGRLDVAIADALGIVPDQLHHPEIKEADDEVMYREAAALKWSHGVGTHWNNDKAYEPWPGMGWSPQRAERLFYERHHALA